MMQELKKYQVNIFGESYTVLSDDPQKEIIDTATYVDSLMRETAGKNSADAKKIAIFVALKIAKKMFDLETEKVKWKESQENLVKLIDEQVNLK